MNTTRTFLRKTFTKRRTGLLVVWVMKITKILIGLGWDGCVWGFGGFGTAVFSGR